jgi:hypothetical protein
MMKRVDHGEDEAKKLGIHRSSKWPDIEKAHLAKNPHCACCTPGTNVGAQQQVHHKFPFHYCIALGRPDLELDDRNLITLCEHDDEKSGQNHHLLVGHLDDFQSSNLDVVLDAEKTFHGMSAAEIKANTDWKSKLTKRLKPLSQMTDEDKAAFVKLMNDTFPKTQP